MNAPQQDVITDATGLIETVAKGIAFDQICDTLRDEFGSDPRTVV
jgi:hypothetical protein